LGRLYVAALGRHNGLPFKDLNTPDHIDEKTLLFVIQLGQIIRKITEIVAHTQLDMVTQVAV
jgi:hypothetical protein